MIKKNSYTFLPTPPIRAIRMEDIYRWAREKSAAVTVVNMTFVLPEGWRYTYDFGIPKEGFMNAMGEFPEGDVSFFQCLFLPLDKWPNWSEKVAPFEDLEKAFRILPTPGAT